MNYWFASHPELPISLAYSDEQYQNDLTFFKILIREIAELPDEAFIRTSGPRQVPLLRLPFPL